MKLDLWKCDRCPSTEEAAPTIGMPNGWMTVTFTKKEEKSYKDKHLCPKCVAALHDWFAPPDTSLAGEWSDLDATVRARKFRVGEVPREFAVLGYAECPSCAAVLHSSTGGDGETKFRHVLARF